MAPIASASPAREASLPQRSRPEAETLALRTGTARMPDGTLLRTLHWPVARPWARALLVHGLGEHAGRYATVAAALTGAGIDVHGYDHRGMGGSAGPRAHVERWSILHDDLGERLRALRDADPGRPLVLYGHSMGGLVAAGYVLDAARPRPDLLVLSSPGLDVVLPAWKRRLAAGLTRVVPRLRLANGLPRDGRSRDPRVGAGEAADPLCLSRSTVRFGAEGLAEQVRVRAALAGLHALPLPTYVLHGTADPIVPVSVTDHLARLGNVTVRLHEGLRHECHHEPEHAQVLAEVVAWIRSALPAASPV